MLLMKSIRLSCGHFATYSPITTWKVLLGQDSCDFFLGSVVTMRDSIVDAGNMYHRINQTTICIAKTEW